MTRRENGCVDDVARLDLGPIPALPHRIDGKRWSAVVDHCTRAWLRCGGKAAGYPAPTMATQQADRLIAWIAPGKWLVIGPSAAAIEGGRWFDRSSRYVEICIDLGGRDFATAMTGIDPAMFEPGRSVLTRLAGLPVIILPRATDLLILVDRGRERYWIDWLGVAVGATDTALR